MTDVVNRLQDSIERLTAERNEATAEIERLREALHWWQSIEQVRLNSKIERLQAALQALADDTSVPPWIRTLARRTLESKP